MDENLSVQFWQGEKSQPPNNITMRWNRYKHTRITNGCVSGEGEEPYNPFGFKGDYKIYIEFSQINSEQDVQKFIECYGLLGLYKMPGYREKYENHICRAYGYLVIRTTTMNLNDMTNWTKEDIDYINKTSDFIGLLFGKEENVSDIMREALKFKKLYNLFQESLSADVEKEDLKRIFYELMSEEFEFGFQKYEKISLPEGSLTILRVKILSLIMHVLAKNIGSLSWDGQGEIICKDNYNDWSIIRPEFVMPQSLLSAMYLMLYMDITKEKLKKCVICGNFFTHSGKREKHYCGPANGTCGQNYRQRKRRKTL